MRLNGIIDDVTEEELEDERYLAISIAKEEDLSQQGGWFDPKVANLDKGNNGSSLSLTTS